MEIQWILNITRSVIYSGLTELKAMKSNNLDNPKRPSGTGRIRRPGAGRKGIATEQKGIIIAAENILQNHSAGSPTDENITWTSLKPKGLMDELASQCFQICKPTAKKIISDLGFKRRSLRKEIITGYVDPILRDEQFIFIGEQKRLFNDKKLPVFSIDTKKKELIGLLQRPGKCYSTGAQRVYDHDYRHLATGVAIPHGIYDLYKNFGFITIGNSHETSEYICDAIARCWYWYGRYQYPEADEILLLFDAGGRNSIHSTRFKEDLIYLSQRLNIKFRVAHYPPYTSKWNPIEHRLFSQVEKALSGIIPNSIETIHHAIKQTKTTTGLSVKAYILDKVYQLGRKCSKSYQNFKADFIKYDDERSAWNYIVNGAGI